MRHRSPLITLAGLVAGFAIMFGLNLVAAPARSDYNQGSATNGAANTPTPATGSGSATPSPTASPSVTPTKKARDSQSEFPSRVVYAGRTEDGRAAIAVAILGEKAAAYYCDGHQVESWLRGSVAGDKVTLRSKSGAVVRAQLHKHELKGRFRSDGQRADFEIAQAKKPAGLYRAKGSKTTIGWIVLPDGSQVGIKSDQQSATAAPTLDPDAGSVTIDNEQITVAPVSGDEEVSAGR